MKIKTLVLFFYLFSFSLFGLVYKSYGVGRTIESFIPSEKSEDKLGVKDIEKFFKVIEMIQHKYPDKNKVDISRLIDFAINGMLSSLDPHCDFFETNDLYSLTENYYKGIGIRVSYKNKILVVSSVREDGPAARSGILAGDIIIKINDQLLDVITKYSELLKLLNGEAGQAIDLIVKRPSSQEIHEFHIVREVISQGTVKGESILNEKYVKGFSIGYIRILQFSHETHQEFKVALNKLELNNKLDALVIDLRNNPGGLVETAINICEEFLPPDTTVATLEGRNGKKDEYKTSKKYVNYRKYPLAILLDHVSASASELVTGALKDLKRAVVVGETSFGKGSVQSIMKLMGSKDEYIRLTVANYFTPKHMIIHEKGIKPDVIVPLSYDEYKLLKDWWNIKDMPKKRQLELADFVDKQLLMSANILTGILATNK